MKIELMRWVLAVLEETEFVDFATAYPFTAEAAESFITANADDDWKYEKEPRGKFFVIAVYDEEGVKLGYL